MSKEKIYEPTEGEYIGYYRIEDEMKVLAGRVLTLIDASIQDKEQRKALKDLIRMEFSRRIGEFQDLAFKGTKGHSVKWETIKPYDPLN